MNLKKRCILALLYGLLCSNLSAQIELEFSHTSFIYAPVKLSKSGWKYIDQNQLNGANQILLLNLDGSLFKELTLPAPYNGVNPIVTFYMSETLFDQDSTNIEYMLIYGNPEPNESWQTAVVIANEFGEVLFVEENANTYEVFSTGRYYYSIYETDDGTKMQLTVGAPNEQGFFLYEETKVYSLAGSYPTDLFELDPIKPKDFEHYPNPSLGKSVIKMPGPDPNLFDMVNFYNPKGELVRSIPIPPNQQQFDLEYTDLPNGSYFFQLRSSQGAHSVLKPLVLIR